MSCCAQKPRAGLCNRGARAWFGAGIGFAGRLGLRIVPMKKIADFRGGVCVHSAADEDCQPDSARPASGYRVFSEGAAGGGVHCRPRSRWWTITRRRLIWRRTTILAGLLLISQRGCAGLLPLARREDEVPERRADGLVAEGDVGQPDEAERMTLASRLSSRIRPEFRMLIWHHLL